MSATPTAFSYGRNTKLYIGNAATSVLDSDFLKVVNENSVSFSYKSNNDKVVTKEAGQVTIPQGDEAYEIKGTADVVFADPALVTFIAARNLNWPYQLRDVSGGKVEVEGTFVLTSLDYTYDAKGAVKISFTMENSNAISMTVRSVTP